MHLSIVRVTLGVLVAFLAAGAAIYGVSPESFERGWTHILARPDGSMNVRFILQPTAAALAALHDGINDARLGRSPYLWTIVTDPEARGTRVREGLTATAKTILIGLAVDIVYQLTALGTVYPGEAVLMALGLGFVPYLLLRGPFARAARLVGVRPEDKH